MLLTRLRDDTRYLHDNAEQTLGILNGVPTTKEYLGLLERFYGYYKPVELALFTVPWNTIGFDWPLRRKASLLEQDLQALGESQPAIDSLPLCRDLPPLDSVPKALGCIYVLEGATLGGQVIVRRLQGLALPTAFFGSYGENVRTMWKEFGAFLTEYTTGRGEDDEVVQSACKTFETIGTWLAGEQEDR